MSNLTQDKTLKVLHITYTTSGGAGIAVLRLHKALLAQGVESKVLVGQTDIVSNDIVKVTETMRGRFKVPKIPFADKVIRAFRRKGLCMTYMEKLEYELAKLDRKYPAYFDLPLSSFELEKHPLAEWADVINIHWISGFIDFPTFFAYVKKPIVWTMHDLNPFYGGFHHIRLREKYFEQYKHLETESYNIKKEAVSSIENMTLVALSSEMERLMRKHEIYNNKRVFKIHNCVEPSCFSKLDKTIVREMLGLPTDKKVLLFVNKNMNDSEKGLTELVNSLEMIDSDEIMLVCVGDGVVPESKKRIDARHYNSVKDTIWLTMLYSATDFLVQPSHQEAFPLTPIEAMCCGTPVIITPVSGAEDMINESNGVIADGYSSADIARAIKLALCRQYDSGKIRDYVVENFSPEHIATQYIGVYSRLFN